jgi:hypothetical protein
MGDLMVSNRGFIPAREKVIVICTQCKRPSTRFMSICLNTYKQIYKCISCYNSGGSTNA